MIIVIAISFFTLPEVNGIGCLVGQRITQNGTDIVINNTLEYKECNISGLCLRLDTRVSIDGVLNNGKNFYNYLKLLFQSKCNILASSMKDINYFVNVYPDGKNGKTFTSGTGGIG